MLNEWKSLTSPQKHAFVAAFLGWTLDAFDFFLMIYVLGAIAAEFKTNVTAVSVAVTLTLAMRPAGALFFGALADQFGRRPILMIDILLFAILELVSAFAPTLLALIVIRAAFGFAMGGEWGIGSSLAMETIPKSARGLASGVIQEGYACGNLLAGLVYWLLFDHIGWRGMFMVGVLPALLVMYIRRNVQESPVWHGLRERKQRRPIGQLIASHWVLFLYVVVLMTSFNLFSHGTQDLYPTFLKATHKFTTQRVGIIAAIGNVGAIMGGIFFGRLSQRIGRRRAIVYAALLALPVIPLWGFANTTLMLVTGLFFMQISVQGAWGVIPVHLNELSPNEVRGTFPGFAYQLGNLFASGIITVQASYAEHHGNNYPVALAAAAGAAAILIAVLTSVGREAHGVEFGGA